MRLFDLHCDTVSEGYRQGLSLRESALHVDFRRAARYAPWHQVFAVWIPDTLRGEAAFDYCERVLNYATEQNVIRQGGLLGIESGAALGGDLRRIRTFAESSVRVMTLTWNGSNELGHGCLSGCEDGLTTLGKAAIPLLEQYGIVADVSHLNQAGFWEVYARATRPFIASHSASDVVCPHPRNLTDRQFCAIRERGGLVGLTACAAHVGAQTFDGLYRHLTHFWELDGVDTLALGFDLDGTELPAEWQGIAVYETLADYLLSRGVPQSVLDRLFYDNAYRFFSGDFT